MKYKTSFQAFIVTRVLNNRTALLIQQQTHNLPKSF